MMQDKFTFKSSQFGLRILQSSRWTEQSENEVSFVFGAVICTVWPRVHFIIIKISILPFRLTHET